MTSAELAYVGIDLGTQGVRCIVVDARGAILAQGSRPLESERTGVRHTQDAEQWWAAVGAAARPVLAAVRDRTIAGLSVDSTSGTVVVEDATGRPTGPALMYDDARAVEAAERAAVTGARTWRRAGYRMQTSWALPKLMWLLDHDAVPHGGRICHQADHIFGRLAGHPVATDTSHALKSGVDLDEVGWPVELFAELGIDAALLPEVVLPGAALGQVCSAAAAATGIPEGTMLRAGMTDGCAAQVAARALRPGSWSSALGTTLVVKGATAQRLHDPAGAVYCHRHPDGGWLPGGASSVGAGVLARDFPAADLDALTGAAARLGVVPGVTYPLVGRGERFPFISAAAVGFVEDVPDDEVSRFGGVLQGIAFVERLTYETLGTLGADVTGPVTVSGGATRNRYWNQLRCDVLGRPVLRPASVEAALGAAVIAASVPGRLTETAEAMVQISDSYQPDAERGAELDGAYARFVAALVERGWLAAGPVRTGVGR